MRWFGLSCVTLMLFLKPLSGSRSVAGCIHFHCAYKICQKMYMYMYMSVSLVLLISQSGTLTFHDVCCLTKKNTFAKHMTPTVIAGRRPCRVHSFTQAWMHAHTNLTRTQTQTPTPTPTQTNKQTHETTLHARVVFTPSSLFCVLLVTQTSMHECV